MKVYIAIEETWDGFEDTQVAVNLGAYATKAGAEDRIRKEFEAEKAESRVGDVTDRKDFKFIHGGMWTKRWRIDELEVVS